MVLLRLGSGGPILGDNLLLMAIASVVLGGTNIMGVGSITTVSEVRPHIRHRAVKQRGGVDDGGLGGEVRELRRAAGRRAGPCGPARPVAGLLHGPATAG